MKLVEKLKNKFFRTVTMYGPVFPWVENFPTHLQMQIEKSVTNGLGYDSISKYRARFTSESNEDLSAHLGQMDLLTNENPSNWLQAAVAGAKLQALLIRNLREEGREEHSDVSDRYKNIIKSGYVIDTNLMSKNKNLMSKILSSRMEETLYNSSISEPTKYTLDKKVLDDFITEKKNKNTEDFNFKKELDKIPSNYIMND